MVAMTFGEKLAKLSEARGWKAAEVARRLKVSPNTVGRWLADERRPFDDVLLSVARLFSVQADFLVDEAQERVPAPELTEDERFVLRLVRASGLSADDVAKALTGYAVQRRESPGGGVAPSYDPETGRPLSRPQERRQGAG
jgi:transcriptional regulator with XRE-family HTH domain